MKKVEFVRLERKVSYENANEVCQRYYSNAIPDDNEKGINKDKLYIIVADVYGVPYAFEIGKKIRKYTSGKVQSPAMVERISESLKRKELFLDNDGAIENIDKILKKVVAETGYC